MLLRKPIFLLLVLLLVSVGIVVAQSSANYVVQRFVVAGGGLAESVNYKVNAAIGQPVTDVADSSNYKVSGGFLYPFQQNPNFHNKIWLPVIIK